MQNAGIAGKLSPQENPPGIQNRNKRFQSQKKVFQILSDCGLFLRTGIFGQFLKCP